MGVMINKRAFPGWVPDVIAYEEASQINMDEFVRSVIRDPLTGKKNKKSGKAIEAQCGIVHQIIMLGDSQQLESDIRASYNVQRMFFL